MSQEDGNEKSYIKKNDKLEIGGAELSEIRYDFWRGKFHCVTILAEGYGNFSHLKEATFSKFGKGHQPNPYIKRYMWFGEGTGIVLEYNEISKKTTLAIFDTEMMEQIQNEKKEQAEKGANDF